MKFGSPTSTAGFLIGLTLLTGLFLIGVGLGPNALPYPPGQQSGVPQTVTTPLGWPFSDAIISHWPAALFLQRSVRAGAFPLWRPLLMSGQPFAANPLNKVWYPPQWLVILLPVTLHLNLLIWGHLVLAGLGMRALALRLDLSAGVAAIMGLAYALTPRLAAAAGAGHLDVVYATAWFPWVLWAVHVVVVRVGSGGRYAAMLGLVSALCFLADIRLSLFVFTTGALFGLWLLFQVSSARRQAALVALVLAGALAAGLTAVEWLPLLQLAPYLSRNGMTIQDAGLFSLQPAALIAMIFPNRGGLHETMVYVGIPVLILAIIGFAQSPRRHAIWAVIALAGAFYAFGSETPLWPLLVKILPPLLWFRVPARAWIVVVVALLILAGFGLQTLLVRRNRTRWLSLAGVGLIGMGAMLGIVGASLALRPGASVAAALGLIGFGVLLLVRGRLSASAFTLSMCALIALDLAWMDISLVAGLPQSIWLDTYAPVALALRDAGVTRVYSPDYSLPQEAAAYWDIPDLGGVDPFQLRPYVAAFENATGIHATGYSVTLPAFKTANLRTANRDVPIDAARLAEWNVSHVLTSYPLDMAGLHLVRQIDDLYLYENMLRPAGVMISWNGPNRFTAMNASDRPINISAWSPGWDSTGSEAAITIAPGQTTTHNYTAPGLLPGVALSLLSVIIIGAIFSRTNGETTHDHAPRMA